MLLAKNTSFELPFVCCNPLTFFSSWLFSESANLRKFPSLSLTCFEMTPNLMPSKIFSFLVQILSASFSTSLLKNWYRMEPRSSVFTYLFSFLQYSSASSLYPEKYFKISSSVRSS